MEDMVKNLRDAFRSRILNLTWMDNETKSKALEKLDTMEVRVGYPDVWQNYSWLRIDNDSYVKNVLRAGNFQFLHGYSGLDKAGKLVNREVSSSGCKCLCLL